MPSTETADRSCSPLETDAWLDELRTLLETPDDDSAMPNGIAEIICNHLNAACVRIWMLSPDRQWLNLESAAGISLPFDALQDHVPVQGSELGTVIATRQPYAVDCLDRATPAEVRGWAMRAGAAAFFAVPIVTDSNAAGVLGVFTRERLTGCQSRRMESLAGIIANGCRRQLQSSAPMDSEQLLLSLLPCLTSAVITLNRQGCITRWSTAAERLFGWSEAELLGKPLPMLPDQREHSAVPVVGINRMRITCQRADLSRVPVLRTTAPLYDGRGELSGRVELFADDSQHVRAERTLHVQAHVTRILAGARSLDTALYPLLTAIGEWLDCDVVEFWKREDLQNVLTRGGVWAKSCEVRDRLAAMDVRIDARGDDWLARVHRAPQITCEMDVLSPAAAALCPLRGAITTPIGAMAIPILSNGDRFGVLTCTSHLFCAPDELTTQSLRFVADAFAQFLIRMRTEAELERSQSSLRQTQKMDAIGLLAGGVAHDFNNLLTIILAYSEMGLDEIDAENPLHELFSEIHGASERAAAMTRRLLAVSRQQPAQVQLCHLNQLVSEMERMLQRLIGPQISLTHDCSSDLPCVQADLNQLEQILLNLVVNARDAMPEGGSIRVQTRAVECTARDTRPHGVLPGPFVQLIVSDTGCGMDKATQARIFEPFFTTKGVGKGTGMGLATVCGIVQQSGGFITVNSEVNVGTTFSVFLPQARQALVTQTISAAVESSHNGAETILVVENDDALRSLIRRLLEVRGYKILEAADGGAARKLLDATRSPIALVLAEVHLPVLDGMAFRKLIHARPNAPKCLLMSGSSEAADSIGHDAAEQILRKPFTSAELASRIRTMLDSGSPASNRCSSRR